MSHQHSRPTGRRLRARRHVRVLGTTIVVGLALLAPAAAHAQQRAVTPDTGMARGTVTLAGVVRDSAGSALSGAEVRVGGAHSTLSDARGGFVLRDIPVRTTGPDTLALVVRRIGYEPASVRVAVDHAGLRIDLAVTLLPNIVRLGTIVVEGKTYDRLLWDVGYYQRQRVGYGRFIGPDYLEHFGGSGVSTLLREIPRVMVEREHGETFVYGPAGGVRCRMNVFIDGRFAREANMVGIDELVPREDVHAVEVYPTIVMVPNEFQRIGPAPGTRRNPPVRLPSPGHQVSMTQKIREQQDPGESNDAACGAIVVWTKPFTARQRARTAAARAP